MRYFKTLLGLERAVSGGEDGGKNQLGAERGSCAGPDTGGRENDVVFDRGRSLRAL